MSTLALVFNLLIFFLVVTGENNSNGNGKEKKPEDEEREKMQGVNYSIMK